MLADSHTCTFVCARIYPAPFYSWIPPQVQVEALRPGDVRRRPGLRPSQLHVLPSSLGEVLHIRNSDGSVLTRSQDVPRCHAASRQVSRRREGLKRQTDGQGEDQQSSIEMENTPTEGRGRWREVKRVREDRKTAGEEGWRRSRNTWFLLLYLLHTL